MVAVMEKIEPSNIENAYTRYSCGSATQIWDKFHEVESFQTGFSKIVTDYKCVLVKNICII